MQGTLGVIAALVSIYLFSVLGVPEEPNDSFWLVGAGGGVASGVFALIELFTLSSKVSKGTRDGQVGKPQGLSARSANSMSVGNIEDGMIEATMVKV